MMQTYFITGTDTDVGKTYVACHLLNKFRQQGKKTIAFKPIASGCHLDPNNKAISEDALLLLEAMTESLDYDQVNPLALLPAIAPHLALEKNQQIISVKDLMQYYERIKKNSADVCVIEGAGGWRVPINAQETWVDFVKSVCCPVVLVVGLRLGCINHAWLTAEAIQSDGVQLAGWIANEIDPNLLCKEEIVATLQAKIKAPYWGPVPFLIR